MTTTISMSEDVTKIMPALVKVQTEIESVSKDAKNPFYKSKYATLQNVVDSTRPVLVSHGIAVTQWPTSGERGEIGVITLVSHESGQWLQHGYTVHADLGKNPAQEAGKVITYFRRYGYAAALGIVIDEDEDGNNAGQRNKAKNKPAVDLTDLNAAAKALYGDDAAKMMPNVMNALVGKNKSADLTKEDATTVVMSLNKKIDAIKKLSSAAVVTLGQEWKDTLAKEFSATLPLYNMPVQAIIGLADKVKGAGDAKQGELVKVPVKNGAHS